MLLKRLSTKTATAGIKNLKKLEKSYRFNKNLANLVRKGNEGARHKDPHTCNVCMKTYASHRSLKHHMEAMQNSGNSDHRQWKSEYHRMLERLVKRGNKKAGSRDLHTCCFCKNEFTARGGLKHHLESSQNKGSWDHCKWKSERGEKVDAFVKKGNEGAGSRDPHTCCFCKKLFNFRCSLKLHIEAAHYQENKLSCDLCGRSFFNKPSMAQHMKGCHSKKTLYCNLCDYKTIVSRYFEFHKMKHAATCPVCNKQVASLKTHIALHREKVPCPICRKAVLNAAMKAHMRKQHYKIECKICNEVLENRKYLRW